MNRVLHYVNGKSLDGVGRTAPVFDPATGEQTGDLVLASAAEVAQAVAVAKEALPGWRSTTLSKRTEMVFRLRQLITERSDELAAIISAEHGKVFSDAKGEIARGLENVDFTAGLIHLLKGDYSEQISSGIDIHQVKQPVGVVACITPFNFPAMVPLWMVTSAIVCGNTVVLKPSEKDPSVANFLAELFTEAGLPDGVLNVVHGDKEAVDALLDDEDVKAVSFVGSTPIAKYVYTRASANGKRVQALGGAKNHMVVMPDADLGTAADAAVSAAYGSTGERCMAVSVVVAVGPIADELVSKIADRVVNLVTGPASQSDAEMGPLITAEALTRVTGYVAGAEAEGATLVVDGRTVTVEGNGFFIGPSLVDHVTPGMKVYDDEIFGPVLVVVRVDSYDDAVNLVNANAFGNGTAIFTRDGKTARQYEYDIEVGMVGVNVPVPVPIGAYSFGGWKASLFGDSHIYGPESVHFYTRSKVVTTRWPEPSESQIDLGFPSN
jgi:malonate-semialdehyde dehydrogenase (acetylating)/methylmalonate-semialdehyde dehydrogenase